jgi:uncharacterized protein (DUF983 family)
VIPTSIQYVVLLTFFIGKAAISTSILSDATWPLPVYLHLIQIKHALRMFSLIQLRRLDDWLHELIRKTGKLKHAEESPPRKLIAAGQLLPE